MEKNKTNVEGHGYDNINFMGGGVLTKELAENITDYFAFCLTPGPGYLVHYVVATYLTLQHKFVISKSELQLAKEYLLSEHKNILYCCVLLT